MKDILVTYTNGATLRVQALDVNTEHPKYLKIETESKTILLSHVNILGLEIK